jgi:hypothetical protein
VVLTKDRSRWDTVARFEEGGLVSGLSGAEDGTLLASCHGGGAIQLGKNGKVLARTEKDRPRRRHAVGEDTRRRDLAGRYDTRESDPRGQHSEVGGPSIAHPALKERPRNQIRATYPQAVGLLQRWLSRKG